VNNLYRPPPVRAGVFAALAVAAASAALAGGSGASAQAAPTLHDLRVCGATSFSRELQECTADESAAVLTSNRITCSVEVDLDAPARLQAWMTYNGARIDFAPADLQPGQYTRWSNENLKIDRPLPGGAWTCGFTLSGTTLTASFKTDGPVGDVVNTAACRYASTVRFGSGRVCRTDESPAPIPATNAIACYATYPSAAGKFARLTIVRGGRVVQAASQRIGVPLAWAWIWTKAPRGSTLPGGSYECRYWLAGKPVAKKPFRLKG